MSTMQLDPQRFASLYNYLIEYREVFKYSSPVPLDSLNENYTKEKPRYKSDSVRLLQLMNARSYYFRYSHMEDIRPRKPMSYAAFTKTAPKLSHVEAYKLIEAILYNCELYDDSQFIKEWEKSLVRLGKFIIANLDEYKSAHWG